MIRRPPRSTLSSSSAASDVYKRQVEGSLSALGSDGGFEKVLLEFRGLFGSGTKLVQCNHSNRNQQEFARFLNCSSTCSTETCPRNVWLGYTTGTVSYTHLRAHETPEHLVCRLLLEKKKKKDDNKIEYITP
eukprot:TRINITY_DN58538_c0_g1_i1.p1 TRINITY_DN58538_c0_g1~~TRINITY_DN58538_c0_g1_i1.p1  ORF type:complete len:132 (-),score=39.02 TRINITY_DN58538_c0_g1_i1:82-477(-)